MAALLLNSLFDVTSTLKARVSGECVLDHVARNRARNPACTDASEPVCPGFYRGRRRDGAHLGRPVFYDLNAPALPTATSAGVLPILFGDFKQGFMIGVRGGAGINVKILDQPWASAGQIGILAYRRLDARVRRSEAIQSITVSHS